MTKDEFIFIVEHYVPNKQDRDSVLSAAWDYTEALILTQNIFPRPLCVKCDWAELPDKSSICRNCGGACPF